MSGWDQAQSQLSAATAKPQLVHLGAAPAEWIFHREKFTLKTAREGYSHCGFAL
jgi:hypothetical protein